MDLSSYLADANTLWSSFQHDDSTTIDVSTLWHSPHADNTPTYLHETINAASFLNWLQTSQEKSPRQSSTLLSQVVWIRRDSLQKVVHISDKLLEHITAKFELGGALDTTMTSYAGVQRLCGAASGGLGGVSRYCFGIHPKIILVWSHSRQFNLIKAVCFADERQISQLRQLTELRWHDPMMALLLACATVLSTEVDRSQESAKEQIRMVEMRTGYHNWRSRSEARASGDLAVLSAQMSGLASKMASVSRKTSVIEQMLQFVSKHESAIAVESNHADTNEDVVLLNHRLAMHRLDTDFIRQRIDVQISALFNLIAQNDAMASHTIANQSKIVAVASQRDSTSMKTLAVVTIFFLPGQVVASIFAMPLFNWTAGQSSESGGPVVNDRLKFYWAITIPLTLLTFVLAGLWLGFEHHRQQRRIEVIEASKPSTMDTSEISVLTRRRSTAGTM